MVDLVLVRHGQSLWNLENRFTGWTDVDLSDQGREEALKAGERLKAAGFAFDQAHTSVLTRAVRTLWIILDAMNLLWLPVHRSWRLNERHYGALQGLDKAETTRLHGEDQVRLWRRSFDVPPPLLPADDPRHPGKDPRYAKVDPALLPRGESLKECLDRVMPYWHGTIEPELKAGERLIIAAHGNSLRALCKHLENISDQEIAALEIPTGVPLVYSLGDDLSVKERRYLE